MPKSVTQKEEEKWNLTIRDKSDVKNTNGLSNTISNTKYNILTWLPKSLLEQFRRIANVYFLVISILMFIGTYATYLFQTPLDPYSTVVTLIFVLLVTCIKEGMEDLARARSDKEENCRKVTVVRFDTGIAIEHVIENQQIKAGDIVKLTGRTSVPADMVLIMTSNFTDSNQCYIETANIDGETNLKVREAPVALKQQTQQGIPEPTLFKGTMIFEPPNNDIHNFKGALTLDYLSGEAKTIPLGSNNILLRSALFSNTDWAYGIAIYTGQETKIQMNSRHAPSKMSKLEGYLNDAIKIIFVAQVILVSISVISIYILGFQNFSKIPYVYVNGEGDSSILPLWLSQWFVLFLLYNNFIPISLYVTIELVNVGQAFLIGSDENIYDEALDCPCLVRSSNMGQELGMVSNIFSDKTGTLTRNEMILEKFVIDGTMYSVNTPDQSSSDGSNHNNPVWTLIHGGPSPKKDKVVDFLRCLTTCHTVVREKDGTYRAESPDELALIEGVKGFECALLERGTASMSVEMVGDRQEFDILAVNPFNSDRKRMSILVKDHRTEEYIVMCKGADNIMLPLCKVNSEMRRGLDKSLSDLAVLGLRTLCIAHKKISARAAEDWLAAFTAASSSMGDRATEVARVGASLELDMELLGITAIEDKLQDEVPEVIADLAKAGIIVWMLTGDKEETAVNIGRSCNLVLGDTVIRFINNLNDASSYKDRLFEVHSEVTSSIREVDGKKRFTVDGVVKELVLVMDGPSFSFFDATCPDQRAKLLEIGKYCRSVIGCRLTPLQKQQVVNVVKVGTKPRAITLAIGDGANDVSMIREADVGVGIFGKEGRQAANNADFAIGQFKFLRRLLLVHGRWNYSRQSRVFLYSMHKNMVITLTLFWFTYFSAISGTSIYESWVYTSFNFVLGLPIIFYGIQDRDLSDKFVLSNPSTYSTGTENVYLTPKALGIWILNAIYYAILLCLIYFYVVGPTFEQWGVFEMGTTIFFGMCLALQAKVAFLHHQWTWPQVVLMIISNLGMIIWFVIISVTYDDFYYVAQNIYATGIFWFYGFFSGPLITVLVDVVGHYGMWFFFPSKEMMFREFEHRKEFLDDPFVSSCRMSTTSRNEKVSHASLKESELPTHLEGMENKITNSGGLVGNL